MAGWSDLGCSGYALWVFWCVSGGSEVGDYLGFTEHNRSHCSGLRLAFVKSNCLFNISSPSQTQKATVSKARLCELIGESRDGKLDTWSSLSWSQSSFVILLWDHTQRCVRLALAQD
jgi:hypothetical protein